MSHPEQSLSERELSPLIEILARKFVQRWDMYPRQFQGQRPYFTVHEPLHVGLLAAHLRGEITLGTYLLNAQSHGRFMVVDADEDDSWQQLVIMAQQLSQARCQAYLEHSRRGGHLWLFFDSWLPATEIRRFGQGLLKAHGITKTELFPKQDELRDGPGSLIRLPFGVHQATGRRYGFYTSTGEPLAFTLREQGKLLATANTVPNQVFTFYREYAPQPPPQAEFEPLEAAGEQVSDRIKASISCRDLISQYVELDERGRGRCPFHDDQVSSFSVNVQDNFWHCFAGCGGGSIIDFWMMYQRQVEGKPGDFKTAVKELSQLLLK